MASNKTGMTEPKKSSGRELGGALIKILAAGVAGSAALIAGAKMLGDKMTEIEVLDEKREGQDELPSSVQYRWRWRHLWKHH